ncbi:MAG TPA: helix-turn-helix transcriptional regulator [Thermohalobaculum sp.]|nr:helix-turn-helix transcriptional regulator [Thermohalobaculum sp.]
MAAPAPDTAQPQFLTTREVADLLRVKERKVYDLAAAGEIPHRRVTGKLLFPRDEIEAWIAGAGRAPAERPALLAGSHDPLLDWAIRESGCGLASFLDGSTDGLERFGRGEAALAGLHLPEEDGWNLSTVAGRGLRDCVLVAWATRVRGLILAPGLADVRGIADLRGHRVVSRQPGAGSRTLFDRLAAEAGLAPGDYTAVPSLARTETDAAAAVASSEAEAAIGLQAMARQFRLGFVPLVEERFDLLADRRAWFTPPVQTLLAFARTPAFAERATALGGYEISDLGTVRWLSP